ncbi:tumor necrosis factor ligand superfamily member 14 [Microcaecilia unicolor]|uniref:Tumor necrosis factor ligand superfamily member 14 n=1 Tax=Microcaecilia unicolor TaxID=1415580 RepID=A0A6P7XQQ1_9AMPH|nr:tumor necrosis factor ligand superfamily member 14 [Microcaecilia unicolor]
MPDKEEVYPSVFIVDGQASIYPFVPMGRRKRRSCSPAYLVLTFLVLLALAGVAVEAYFLKQFQDELDRASSQLSDGINSSVAKMVQERTLTEEKPAAHVIGADYTQNASGEEALLWEYKRGLAFLHQVDYTNGHLHCRKPGHYFIYSKIQFGELKCESHHKESLLLIHGIYKKIPSYPQEMPLTVNQKPYCNRKDSDQWWDNSFLAGIFLLEEEEELYVKVPSKHIVRIKDGTRSYFGMFMI